MKKILSFISIFLIIFPMFLTFAPDAKATESDKGVWVSRANIPLGRDSPAAVGYGGKMYVIGGYLVEGDSTIPLSRVDIYDPSSDSWSSGSPMPIAKRNPGAVVIGDRIYVIGTDNRTFSYDPETDEWTEHSPMPVECGTGFGLGIVGGKIYVVRGSSTYPSGTYWTYCYDPSSDTWTPKTGIPYHRSIESCASLNGKLYAIGGADPSLGQRVEPTRVDIYDPETDSWELDAIPHMSVPRTHLHPVSPVIDNRLYVIGGWDGYRYLSAVEMYDLLSNTWSTLAPMPTARCSLGTAVVNGKIYAVTGNQPPGWHFPTVNEEFAPPVPPAGPSIPTADFEISVSTSFQIVNPGDSASYTVTITSLNNFNSSVSLSTLQPLPNDTTGSFDPPSVTPTSNSTLTITTSSTTPIGAYTITIDGTSGGITHSTTITLIVGKVVAPPLPLWTQWWFWTIAALSVTTIAFGASTVRYRQKLHNLKKTAEKPPPAVPSKKYQVCPKCGAQLPMDSGFCGKCGAALK